MTEFYDFLPCVHEKVKFTFGNKLKNVLPFLDILIQND